MTEKLSRHKLLLKKRKAQAARSSAENLNSQQSDTLQPAIQIGEIFAGSKSGPTAGATGQAEPRPIRIRQSSLGGRAPAPDAPIESGPSGDSRLADSLGASGLSGTKRLERLPSRVPGGFNIVPGRGLDSLGNLGNPNRFTDLVKNREEGERREEAREPSGIRAKKTDVAKVYQTSRRPPPSGIVIELNN